jgi:hydroxyacyl-ACP dehydratase HTD2-like protein with hotdog domain
MGFSLPIRPSLRLVTPLCLGRGFASQNAGISEIQAELRARKPKLIYDYLVPTSSHLLDISLSDFLPKECLAHNFQSRNLTMPDTKSASHLPEGHHLVYFPIQTPASQLAPDGTDPDHSPSGRFVRRMWAGGEVKFANGWKDGIKLDGSRALCVEDIGDVRLKSGNGSDEKAFVDVWRRYGIVGTGDVEDNVTAIRSQPLIEERRTLVFLPQPQEPAKLRMSGSVTKCE